MKKLLYLGVIFSAQAEAIIKLPQDITLAEVENSRNMQGTIKEVDGFTILDCIFVKSRFGRIVAKRGGWYLMTAPGHFTLIGEKPAIANAILAHIKAQRSATTR